MKLAVWSRTATLVAAAAAVSLLATSAGKSGAQSAPGSPNGMPDIVGVYPGMYVGDAYNRLKTYFPNRDGKVDIHQGLIHGLNADKPLVTQLHIPAEGEQGDFDDKIDVAVTLPPNKQVVWTVYRTLIFQPGKEPSEDAMVAGLRQKYGREMPNAFHGAGLITLQWIFDRQGKPVPASFENCIQGRYGLDSLRNLVIDPTPAAYGALMTPPVNIPGGAACKTFVYLRADLDRSSNGVIGNMSLSMLDLGLALDEGLRTQAALQAVANADQKAAAQRQKKIDKSAVPPF